MLMPFPLQHLLQVIICQEDKARVLEPEPDSCGVRYILYPSLLSLSCLGLLATIIVYSVLGEFHHLPGTVLFLAPEIREFS